MTELHTPTPNSFNLDQGHTNSLAIGIPLNGGMGKMYPRQDTLVTFPLRREPLNETCS